MTARGIRNNNATNLRKGEKWQGMTADQPDPSFVTFKTPSYGLRAAVKVLDTYQEKYHLWTLRGIISRWAPSNENDTEAYVRAVAAACQVKPDEHYALRAGDNTRKLLKAIVTHENGSNPYADSVYDEGIGLARTP